MRRSVKAVLYCTALAIMATGPLAWTAIDKAVRITIDGQSRTVHTVGGHVRDALAASGYQPQLHDVIAPRLGDRIHDGSSVVVRRGRLLVLSVDGTTREVWTTETTVAGALADLGFSDASFTSVSRDARLSVLPTTVDVRTPKLVTIRHDGKTEHLETTDETVAQVLADRGVLVDDTDRLSPSPDSPVTNGQTIVVQRVRSKQVVATEPIPFATKQRNDDTKEVGTTTVVAPGAAGRRQVNYSDLYVDGVFAGRTMLSSTVVVSPQSRIIAVGTKAVTPQEIAAQLLAQRGWGSDQMNCLTLLWNHESGWRINATNADSGAYGIPQALPGEKMASAGPDWQTNARTQITWGLNYISGVYGTPCGAWNHELDVNWY
jgi:resuscitation-promoting factor RpfB